MSHYDLTLNLYSQLKILWHFETVLGFSKHLKEGFHLMKFIYILFIYYLSRCNIWYCVHILFLLSVHFSLLFIIFFNIVIWYVNVLGLKTCGQIYKDKVTCLVLALGHKTLLSTWKKQNCAQNTKSSILIGLIWVWVQKKSFLTTRPY